MNLSLYLIGQLNVDNKRVYRLDGLSKSAQKIIVGRLEPAGISKDRLKSNMKSYNGGYSGNIQVGTVKSKSRKVTNVNVKK